AADRGRRADPVRNPLPLADAPLLGALAALSRRLRGRRVPDGLRERGRGRGGSSHPALRFGADCVVAGPTDLPRGRSGGAAGGRGARRAAHLAREQVCERAGRPPRLAVAVPVLELLSAPAVPRDGCRAARSARAGMTGDLLL